MSQTRKAVFLKNSPKTSEKMAMSLMRMFREGPEVSLSGSPTVSPITAAAWAGVCFFWSTPWVSVMPVAKR